jgi:hypothetical protein
MRGSTQGPQGQAEEENRREYRFHESKCVSGPVPRREALVELQQWNDGQFRTRQRAAGLYPEVRVRN